jgi:hypothetical protein
MTTASRKRPEAGPELDLHRMEPAAELMVLCRALNRAGLGEAARHLAQIAQRPNVLETKPFTRVPR